MKFLSVMLFKSRMLNTTARDWKTIKLIQSVPMSYFLFSKSNNGTAFLKVR